MIRYIPHQEINKAKWDSCIRDSLNRIVYGFTWYLDLVSPGWDALVQGDYESVFPLTQSRKYFIRYLRQPYFTQQLGIFSKNPLTGSLVSEFLDAIPGKFRFIEIHLNSMNKVDADYPVEERLNHEMDLIHSYEHLQARYDQNTRRNVRKAQQEPLTIRRKVEPGELIDLFRANYGKNETLLKYRHYETFRNVMEYCLKSTFSSILGVEMPDKTLCAGVFFLRENDRVILQLVASDARARETGAMFLLIDSFIRENCSQPLILDFEGSNDKNVARFYKGFGARVITYPKLTVNRLPGLVRPFFKVMKNR
jgi:hypothetical protein